MSSALSVLDDIGEDLFDPDLWINGLKAAGAGAVGIYATRMAVDKLPFISGQSEPIRSGAALALSVAAGAVAERWIGKEAAHGFIGGGGGHAFLKLVQSILPIPDDFKVNLGDSYYAPDQYLNQLPEEQLDQVSVEDAQPQFSQVAVEDAEPQFSDLSAGQIASLV